MFKKMILGIAICLGLAFSMQQNCFAQQHFTRPANEYRPFDFGIGFGLDYGGIIGGKMACVLPYRHVSVFGAAGAQITGIGWNVGTTFHIFLKDNKHIFNPNLKIMYGINRATYVVNASEYSKLFTGFTPGIGFEFKFGKKRANGFDIDLNYPIGSKAFEDQLTLIKNDPDVGKITMSPVTVSMGYHHGF
jgi:hypothetical protein